MVRKQYHERILLGLGCVSLVLAIGGIVMLMRYLHDRSSGGSILSPHVLAMPSSSFQDEIRKSETSFKNAGVNDETQMASILKQSASQSQALRSFELTNEVLSKDPDVKTKDSENVALRVEDSLIIPTSFNGESQSSSSSRARKSGRVKVVKTFLMDNIESRKLYVTREMRAKYNIRLVSVNNTVATPIYTYFDPVKYPYPHLFPLRDSSAVQLANALDQLQTTNKTNTHRAMSIFKAVPICNHKPRFYQFLRDHNMSENVPKEYSSVDAIDRFPVVIKPVAGTGSAGVVKASSREQLEHEMRSRPFANTSIQEYIAGDIELAVQFAALNGTIAKMRCIYRNVSVVGGIFALHTQRRFFFKTEYIPCPEETKDLMSRLLHLLDVTGIGCVNMRSRRTGDAPTVAVDFNPRICAALRRDVDLMADLLCAMQFDGRGVPQATVGCVDPQTPEEELIANKDSKGGAQVRDSSSERKEESRDDERSSSVQDGKNNVHNRR